jgi:hypothetical protein
LFPKLNTPPITFFKVVRAFGVEGDDPSVLSLRRLIEESDFVPDNGEEPLIPLRGDLPRLRAPEEGISSIISLSG